MPIFGACRLLAVYAIAASISVKLYLQLPVFFSLCHKTQLSSLVRLTTVACSTFTWLATLFQVSC